jgi:hypothetical protein
MRWRASLGGLSNRTKNKLLVILHGASMPSGVPGGPHTWARARDGSTRCDPPIVS